MTALTTYNKTDVTQRTTTSTSAAEVTQYTVAWSDLTTAGFANGDDVIVLVRWSVGGASTTTNSLSDFRIGSTFAGATVQSSNRTEPDSSNAGRGAREFVWLDRITLATNDNFYIALSSAAAGTARADNFSILVLKLDDLAAGDFRYAEDTSSGDAPDYGSEADGASVTLPSGGGDDWLVIATADWLVDSVTDAMRQQLSLGGTVAMINQWEGEDLAETWSIGSVGYLAAASASAVCKLQYAAEGGNTHDYTRSAIFALRMDAFEAHIGSQDGTDVNLPTTADVFVETNTVDLVLSATRDVVYFAQSMFQVNHVQTSPYSRVQENNTDIIAWTDLGSGLRGTTDIVPQTRFAVASMTSGTKTIDEDSATDFANALFPVAVDHALVAFTTELAAAGGGRVMSSLAGPGGLAGAGGIAGVGGGLAG